jgi:hypothetical protein
MAREVIARQMLRVKRRRGERVIGLMAIVMLWVIGRRGL